MKQPAASICRWQSESRVTWWYAHTVRIPISNTLLAATSVFMHRETQRNPQQHVILILPIGLAKVESGCLIIVPQRHSCVLCLFQCSMSKLATCFEKGIWLACTRESVSVHPFYVAFVWAWRNPIKTSLRVREYIFTSGCDVNLTVVMNVKNERMLPAASIHRHGFPLTNIKLQHSNGIWEITRIVESQLNIFDRCLLWEI